MTPSEGRLLARGTTRLVVAALAAMALARFVPLGAVQFHVQGVAAVVALWPITHHVWAAGARARGPRIPDEPRRVTTGHRARP